MSGYAYQWAKRQQVGDTSAKTLLKTYAHWAAEDYSTWVTNEELELDTEMNIQTIRKARKKLIAMGYLIETEKRIGETRSIVVYQMLAPADALIVQTVDPRTNETISLSPPSREEYEKTLQKQRGSKIGGAKRVQKPSPSKIQAPSKATASPSKSHAKGGEIPPQAPPNFTPNKAAEGQEVYGDSSCNARDADSVDKSAAAADEEKPNVKTESELGGLLVGLEAARGKQLTIDPKKDRIHLLTWVGKGVTAEQLRAAHALAVAARSRDTDARPTYAGFVTQFIAEAQGVSAPAASTPSDWYENGSDIEAKGKELGVRPRKPDEPLPLYRVLVARAAGKGPWIDYVLRDAQRSGSEQYFKFVVDTFGEALLPADFYAS